STWSPITSRYCSSAMPPRFSLVVNVAGGGGRSAEIIDFAVSVPKENGACTAYHRMGRRSRQITGNKRCRSGRRADERGRFDGWRLIGFLCFRPKVVKVDGRCRRGSCCAEGSLSRAEAVEERQ